MATNVTLMFRGIVSENLQTTRNMNPIDRTEDGIQEINIHIESDCLSSELSYDYYV